MSVHILSSIRDVGAARMAWLVDIWGVMHNGVAPFLGAAEACRAFRMSGGTVLLLSNAPRPAAAVATQLQRIGVPDDAYDIILTSGDAARELVHRAVVTGQAIGHLGPDRDLGIYDGLDARLVAPEKSDTVVCTGLVDDERETAETYAPLLTGLARRGVPMICANPDLAVERGGKIIPCAGALAKAYEALGGHVAYAGKPYRPIYDLARERLATKRGAPLTDSDILAIGDGISTDILGAASAGIEAVYIASGVHLARDAALDADAIQTLFPEDAPRPIAAMMALVW
ncbi:MAG: TIGR01459 family HAD-type hydrolase [Hyphomicrobium sp.]|nr:TIGR01459 family HAD-type hydrolase [Hyphomicrobium sp.]